MDPSRRTTSLPKGMTVRILSVISRGGNIYGIDAEEVSTHTGIPIHDHARLSDWASVNDAHFYAAVPKRFSFDTAAAEAVAMELPRVVLFHIIPKQTEKEKTEEETPPPVVAQQDLPAVKVKKHSTPRSKAKKPV